jgi:hypothetical protein
VIDEGAGSSKNSVKKQFSSVIEPYSNNLLKIEKMEHSPVKEKAS